jgi:hypothetical protein
VVFSGRPQGRPGALTVGEPTAGLGWNQRLLGAHLQLLNGPAVAVRIVESEERAAIALVKRR